MQFQQILIRGVPGSGKSTLGRLLESEIPMARRVSSGELMRKKATFDPSLASALSAGELADSRLVTHAVLEQVKRYYADGARLIILDGFPRKLNEVKDWVSLTSSPTLVVHVIVSPAVVVQILLNRRICSSCGAMYNSFCDDEVRPILPKVTGKCDYCPSVFLTARSDDTESTIVKRQAESVIVERSVSEYLSVLVGQANVVQVDSSDKPGAVKRVLHALGHPNSNS